MADDLDPAGQPVIDDCTPFHLWARKRAPSTTLLHMPMSHRDKYEVQLGHLGSQKAAEESSAAAWPGWPACSVQPSSAAHTTATQQQSDTDVYRCATQHVQADCDVSMARRVEGGTDEADVNVALPPFPLAFSCLTATPSTTNTTARPKSTLSILLHSEHKANPDGARSQGAGRVHWHGEGPRAASGLTVTNSLTPEDLSHKPTTFPKEKQDRTSGACRIANADSRDAREQAEVACGSVDSGAHAERYDTTGLTPHGIPQLTPAIEPMPVGLAEGKVVAVRRRRGAPAPGRRKRAAPDADPSIPGAIKLAPIISQDAAATRDVSGDVYPRSGQKRVRSKIGAPTSCRKRPRQNGACHPFLALRAAIQTGLALLGDGMLAMASSFFPWPAPSGVPSLARAPPAHGSPGARSPLSRPALAHMPLTGIPLPFAVMTNTVEVVQSVLRPHGRQGGGVWFHQAPMSFRPEVAVSVPVCINRCDLIASYDMLGLSCIEIVYDCRMRACTDGCPRPDCACVLSTIFGLGTKQPLSTPVSSYIQATQSNECPPPPLTLVHPSHYETAQHSASPGTEDILSTCNEAAVSAQATPGMRRGRRSLSARPASSVPALQPFQISISPECTFVSVFHSYLASTEVIGLLAGTYDADTKALHIRHAVPCKALQINEDTKTNVELDPAHSALAHEFAHSIGLNIIGWYHSHPTFRADPSVRDIENQCNSQSAYLNSHARHGVTSPYVAMIISPNDSKSMGPWPNVRFFHIAPPSDAAAPCSIPVALQVRQDTAVLGSVDLSVLSLSCTYVTMQDGSSRGPPPLQPIVTRGRRGAEGPPSAHAMQPSQADVYDEHSSAEVTTSAAIAESTLSRVGELTRPRHPEGDRTSAAGYYPDDSNKSSTLESPSPALPPAISDLHCAPGDAHATIEWEPGFDLESADASELMKSFMARYERGMTLICSRPPYFIYILSTCVDLMEYYRRYKSRARLSSSTRYYELGEGCANRLSCNYVERMRMGLTQCARTLPLSDDDVGPFVDQLVSYLEMAWQ